MTSKRPTYWRLYALLVASLAMGCDQGPGADPVSDNADGGIPDAASDGLGADAGIDSAAGAPPLAFEDVLNLAADPDALNAVAVPGADYREMLGVCLVDDSLLLSCEDGNCGFVPACCVGGNDCCAPLPQSPLPAFIDFRGCDGLDAGGCADQADAAVDAFGDSPPAFDQDGFTPNGELLTDSGIAIGDALNLGTKQVALDMTFLAPSDCGSSCLESVGVGFVATFDAGDFSDPEVALLFSGARRSVSLVVRGASVGEWTSGSGISWRLVTEPDGTAKVWRDSEFVGSAAFDVGALTAARLLAYGRNLNADNDHAALITLAAEVSVCDAPRAWAQAQTVALDSAPLRASSASVADGGGQTRMAYQNGAAIGWALLSDETSAVTLATDALVATQAYELGGVRDPELVHDGNDWHLFYTAQDTDGRTSIGHAMLAGNGIDFQADGTPTLVASGGITGVSQPTVYQRDGLWVLVARASLAAGGSALHAWYTPSPEQGWALVDDGGLHLFTQVTGPTTDIAHPSIIVHNSAYQLYYARREGTRWSIHLASSNELLAWNPLGEVFAGETTQFDMRGARSPAGVSRAGRVDLYFTGLDGVHDTIGLISRETPNGFLQ